MRHCSRLTIVSLFLLTAGPAFAAGGSFGSQSSGSIVIRVSVAQRAWRTAANTLCVAAAPGSFSLRTNPAGTALPLTGSTADCSARAQAVTLTPQVANGAATLLVVPE